MLVMRKITRELWSLIIETQDMGCQAVDKNHKTVVQQCHYRVWVELKDGQKNFSVNIIKSFLRPFINVT